MSVWKKAVLAGGVGLIGVAFAAQTFAQGGGQGARMGQERPSFEELDANGDGQISVDEVKAFSTARFTALDTNGDGALDRDELLAAATSRAADQAETRIDRMLTWQDDNGDGALSQSEMPGDRMGQMFERMDRDDDGVVSQDEYEQAQDRGGRSGKKGKRGAHGKDAQRSDDT